MLGGVYGDLAAATYTQDKKPPCDRPLERPLHTVGHNPEREF
jgi:hypothetical protein